MKKPSKSAHEDIKIVQMACWEIDHHDEALGGRKCDNCMRMQRTVSSVVGVVLGHLMSCNGLVHHGVGQGVGDIWCGREAVAGRSVSVRQAEELARIEQTSSVEADDVRLLAAHG